MPRRPERFRSFVPAETSLPNPAVLGPDRGAFASKPGRGDRRRTQGNRRLSRACVIEKNLSWSQLGQQYCLNCSGKPGTGIATQRWRPTQKRKTVRQFGDAERLGLNLGNRGSRRTSGGPVGAATAQGAPTTVRPLALI